MKKYLFVLIITIIVCCFFSGCTGSAELPPFESTGVSDNTIQGSVPVVVSPTVISTTVPPTATPVPTRTYKVSAQVNPTFSAGEIVVNSEGTGYVLITKVDTITNKYSTRSLNYGNGRLYLKKDATFEEMGYGEDIAGFDKCSFKYKHYDDITGNEVITIYNSQDRPYGYLSYDTPTSMKFRFA